MFPTPKRVAGLIDVQPEYRQILGAAGLECVQLGHRGFKIFFSLPPALLKPNPNKAKEQEKHIVALLFFLCLSESR